MSPPDLSLVLNGQRIEVPDDGRNLLDILREEFGLTGAKDGCSPQGQCGCCTVLVDGAPRVACVTPVRRVVGRHVTTIEGLDPGQAAAWGAAFLASGASQCGFCTPGIMLRLEALRSAGHDASDVHAVEQALLAHLCRCTGWQTIGEAWSLRVAETPVDLPSRVETSAEERAQLEGGVEQRVRLSVALGAGGFSADTAPADALRAVPASDGGWVVAPTSSEARRLARRVQGRRSTLPVRWPLEIPDGDWVARLRTTWVEPAYLEPDAAWCAPGGEPSSPVANGGAFGAKATNGPHRSPVMEAARRLADEHGRPVLAQISREDTVRWGPKRPPIAGGVDEQGRGKLRVVATPGIADRIRAVAPLVEVEEVEVDGPSTSIELRAAGWAEALVLLAGARGSVGTLRAPNGAQARAEFEDPSPSGRRRLVVEVRCGRSLDEVILRSYCIGAAHMAYSWVTSESISVDDRGEINDLTIRSFGIVRAADMPHVDVHITTDDSLPRNGSDAVFAAVAAATWLAKGAPEEWPMGLL